MGIGYIGAGTNDAKFAAETGITATASGTQANSFRLTNVVSRITTCATAGDAVVLPAAKAGLVRWVTNLGAAALDIYPEVGDNINSLAANVAVRISPNRTAGTERSGVAEADHDVVGVVLVLEAGRLAEGRGVDDDRVRDVRDGAGRQVGQAEAPGGVLEERLGQVQRLATCPALPTPSPNSLPSVLPT